MNPHRDTLTTEDGRTALRMQRRIPHPPRAVWEAVTRPDSLARWFPAEVEADLTPGGTITFRLPGEREVGPAGRVTEADKPRVFAFDWGEEHLRWEIAREGDGSLLTLVHTFEDRFGAASYASGWHLCMTALMQLLDGEPVDVGRDDGDLHEAYLEQFDLGGGAIEDTPAGRRVRFERQLVRPAEAVWAELADGAQPSAGDQAPTGFTAPEFLPGAVTLVNPPAVLEYAVPPEELVRWELGQGTGHGARLILTHTGPDGFDADRALAVWHQRIEQLAARQLELAQEGK